ncbi:MAG: hypothetical protein M0P76_06030 [Candidatus Pacebacteria bacterium]|nr:hypothetical protein [Candidatus Paceibacterota bacterium]
MQDNIQIKSISLYNYEQKAFWVLTVLITCTVAFYLYIIQSTIVNIVERKTAESQIRETSSKVAELEAEITELGKSMDVNLAQTMGYHEISKIDYVSRTPVLTMRD